MISYWNTTRKILGSEKGCINVLKATKSVQNKSFKFLSRGEAIRLCLNDLMVPYTRTY